MTEQPANRASSHERPSPQPRDRERELAEEIVGAFPARRVRSTPGAIRYRVGAPSVTLRSIVFDRGSLARLLRDRDRVVKIEYLKRDLLRCAEHSAEYRYPRPHHHFPGFSSSPH